MNPTYRLLAAAAMSIVLAPSGVLAGEAASRPAGEDEASTMIAIGDEAPDFRLESIAGQTHALSVAVTDKPVVMVFFRGAW